MWKPIFHEGELVAFSCGHIHNTDIGGAVPASLSRTLVEIHQEGIRFTPTKLYKRGELNEELLQVMMTNVRQPEQNWGDLKAFVGAMNTGERKVKEMVEKFGVDIFRRGTEDLMDYAESIRIPDGRLLLRLHRRTLSDLPPGAHLAHRGRRSGPRLHRLRPTAHLFDKRADRRLTASHANAGRRLLHPLHAQS